MIHPNWQAVKLISKAILTGLDIGRMFQQETPMGHTIHCNEKGGNSKDSMEDGLKATKAPT